jgi:hypothetical protein
LIPSDLLMLLARSCAPRKGACAAAVPRRSSMRRIEV